VTIDTEARTGPAKSLNQTERRTSALAPDFFDTIDPKQSLATAACCGAAQPLASSDQLLGGERTPDRNLIVLAFVQF